MKEYLSEIKIPFEYLENISILRLHEQVSRNGRNFGHFPLSEKFRRDIYKFKAPDMEISNISFALRNI